jgi:hypothetical protein
MKTSLSVFLAGALILGAALSAFGQSLKTDHSANRPASGHKSRTHHQSSGSRHSTNSGSKTHSNVPSN